MRTLPILLALATALPVWAQVAPRESEKTQAPIRILGKRPLGHGGPVVGLALLGEDRLVSAGTDRMVRVWRIEDHELVSEFSTGTVDPTCLAVSSRDGLVAVGGGKGELIVWKAETRGFLRVDRPMEHYINGIAFSPDGRWVATGDITGGVGLSSPDASEPGRFFRAGVERVLDLAFLPDNRTLAVLGSRDAGALFDIEDGTHVEITRYADGAEMSLAVSPDGKLIAINGSDSLVRLVDAGTLKTVRVLREAPGSNWFKLLRWSQDGNRIAGMTPRGQVVVWDVPSGQVLWSQASERWLPSMAWGPKGKWLAIADDCGAIRLHGSLAGQDVEKGQLPIAMQYSRDGSRLLLAFESGLVTWDLAAQRVEKDFVLPGRTLLAARLSDDGAIVAAWKRENRVEVRDLRTMTLVLEISEDEGVETLFFAAERPVLVTGSRSKAWALWGLDPPRKLLTFGDPDSPFIRWGAVSSRGDRFLGDRIHGNAGLWPLALGASGTALSVRGTSTSGAISRDGLLFAVGDHQGNVLVRFSSESGERGMIPLPEKRIVSLAFSPDSLRFAVAEGGAAIALCDSASLRVLRRFELPAPCLVTFSPDGRTLASAHAGGCIALWNAHGPPAPARSVDARRAWGDLVSASTPRALRACLDLASQGNEAVRYLANVMTEMPPGEDAGRLVDLLASPDASTRALAMSDLSYQGVIVHRTLQERLKAAPDDAQRAAIEDLLRAPWGTESPSPETRRRAWAVRALEHIGTPASLDLLRTVERSSPSDAERRMVREAADRLEKALSR